MNEKYAYDSAFQNMASSGSAHAARRTIEILTSMFPLLSVIDLGCARGTWPRSWLAHGLTDVMGVDGDYVDRSKLEIPSERFLTHDLAHPFSLGRQFDLAQSLEVAEHLPETRAAGFISDLVSLAPLVLFSAAPPGQGGEHHINERPYEYWRALFARHDYLPVDCLRRRLSGDPGVPAWYRYNMILYVRRRDLVRVPETFRQAIIPDDMPIADIAPVIYKVRKQIVRLLPQPLCDWLARRNARRFPEVA